MTTVASEPLELSRDECMALLAGEQLGRLAVVTRTSRPLIFPVNYGLDGDVVVVRTRGGTKLPLAHGSQVAFEVDRQEPDGSGWSVVVRGYAEVLSDRYPADVVARTEAVAVEPPLPDRDRWLRILPTFVTGRRVGPRPRPPEG